MLINSTLQINCKYIFTILLKDTLSSITIPILQNKKFQSSLLSYLPN